MAPGNLYGSLAPALVVPGVYEALKVSRAKKVYVCNLVTKPGPTQHFKLHDFADELERVAGGPFLDYVIYNRAKPKEELMRKYANDSEFAVDIDDTVLESRRYKVKAGNLLSNDIWAEAQAADLLRHTRSYIRHDPDKVARQIMKIFFS